jgi:SAM-dependent methyltransferase
VTSAEGQLHGQASHTGVSADRMSSALQHRVLEALESAHNYNAWIASLAQPYLGDDPIEVGSGLGVYGSLWLAAGLPRLTVSDLDPGALGALRRRFDGDRRVAVEALDLSRAETGEHSAVVALNVLEHVDDDVAGLRAAARLVRAGGHAVIFVPAFPFALGRFDREIGHHRRYTIASLTETFRQAEIGLERMRYVNAPGLLAWTIAVRVLGLRPRESAALRAWDRLVVPLTRRIEARVAPPFGQSILAVGRVGG